MMSLIDIQNLTIKNTCEKSLIKGIDLKIFSQQINALIGESGAGKSLIAKAIIKVVKKRLCPKLIRLCRGLIYKAKIY